VVFVIFSYVILSFIEPMIKDSGVKRIESLREKAPRFKGTLMGTDRFLQLLIGLVAAVMLSSSLAMICLSREYTLWILIMAGWLLHTTHSRQVIVAPVLGLLAFSFRE
jgi:hypothetical protein